MPKVQVGIIMGSQSDMAVMSEASKILDYFSVTYELKVVSAHRTPEEMFAYARLAKERGLCLIIAGAGGAAHLPGMVASLTPLPVIGVPIRSKNSLEGWDSILSILQMPGGVPVATVALDQAKNAALLAVRILGQSQAILIEKMQDFMEKQRADVLKQAKRAQK